MQYLKILYLKIKWSNHRVEFIPREHAHFIGITLRLRHYQDVIPLYIIELKYWNATSDRKFEAKLPRVAPVFPRGGKRGQNKVFKKEECQ